MLKHALKNQSIVGLVLLAFMCGPLLADTAYWEKELPKSDSATDGYKFYVYQFRKNGGKFTTGSVYHMSSTTFRSTAISTAVKWENEGMVVGIVASKNGSLSEADVRKKSWTPTKRNSRRKSVREMT